jgi:Cdc6-like AAA superfamily ATPase
MRRNQLTFLASALLLAGAVAAQTSDNRFVIVLIGPTGSGKTTQSEFIKREFGISTSTRTTSSNKTRRRSKNTGLRESIPEPRRRVRL